MNPDDCTPSPDLAAALQRSPDDGRPLYELIVPRRPVFDDLTAAPPSASFIATRGTAKGLERIGELRELEALWANPASAQLFRACARAPRLRAIYVAHFKQSADVPIAGAPGLEHLMLDWAPRLADLGFLRDLPVLRTVYLEDMKRVDLRTLPELPNVTGLELGGGMWSTLELDSLEPLTRLPNLRFLRLTSARVGDGSLRPLAGLRALKELYLPNYFELEEVARLAGALPNVVSNTLTPVYAPRPAGRPRAAPYLCPRCGGPREMMTGKPASFLCFSCDAAKYQRRVARWELARAAGWMGGA